MQHNEASALSGRMLRTQNARAAPADALRRPLTNSLRVSNGSVFSFASSHICNSPRAFVRRQVATGPRRDARASPRW